MDGHYEFNSRPSELSHSIAKGLMMSAFLKWLAVVSLAVGFAILGSAFVHAQGWSIKAMNNQIDQTNFLLNEGCSATLIDKEKGILLTANHCIQAQFDVVEKQKVDDQGRVTTEKVRVAKPGTVSQIHFKGPNEVERSVYVFKIKANDADIDLAIVQVQTKLPNSMAAPMACADPIRGEADFAVGNTLGKLYSTVSNGIVSSINRNYAMIGDDSMKGGLIQSTSAVAGGNSGGSLYNTNGEIIGVVVRGFQAPAPIALAVPLSVVKEFLSSNDMEYLWKRCGNGK
jgi:S1-C subfamily serine protease